MNSAPDTMSATISARRSVEMVKGIAASFAHD